MEDFYIFGADVLCNVCGVDAQARTPRPSYPEPHDTGDYPAGPFDADAEESDSPRHCGECGAFIGGALTPEGFDYVAEAFRDFARFGYGSADVLSEWAREYAGALDGMARVYAGAVEALAAGPLAAHPFRPEAEDAYFSEEGYSEYCRRFDAYSARVAERREIRKRAARYKRAHWRPRGGQ